MKWALIIVSLMLAVVTVSLATHNFSAGQITVAEESSSGDSGETDFG